MKYVLILFLLPTLIMAGNCSEINKLCDAEIEEYKQIITQKDLIIKEKDFIIKQEQERVVLWEKRTEDAENDLYTKDKFNQFKSWASFVGGLVIMYFAVKVNKE